MTNIDAVGAPAPPPPPPCPNPTIDLEVDHAVRTLKHAHANRLKIVVSPASCRASAYKIEIQRASGGAWFPLATTRSFRWLARVAGTFKLRGTATIDGADVQSGTKDVELRFPTYAEMVGDGHTRRAAARVWAETLRNCTQHPVNQRRELGYWIQLNTRPRVNRYVFTHRTEGSWRLPGQGASVSIPPRPADTPASPDPNANGATYPVASFHTHTPTTYRPLGLSPRGVGPSGGDPLFPGDMEADTADTVPGVVYDYVESPAGSGGIPMAHPLHAPARLYCSLGIDPRPTP